MNKIFPIEYPIESVYPMDKYATDYSINVENNEILVPPLYKEFKFDKDIASKLIKLFLCFNTSLQFIMVNNRKNESNIIVSGIDELFSLYFYNKNIFPKNNNWINKIKASHKHDYLYDRIYTNKDFDNSFLINNNKLLSYESIRSTIIEVNLNEKEYKNFIERMYYLYNE